MTEQPGNLSLPPSHLGTGAGEGDFLGRLALRALTGAGAGAGAGAGRGAGAARGGAGEREGRAGLGGAGAGAGAGAGREALLRSRD